MVRKKIRLFDSQDLEEEGKIELTSDPNIETVRMAIYDHCYLILQSVNENDESFTERLELVVNRSGNPNVGPSLFNIHVDTFCF